MSVRPLSPAPVGLGLDHEWDWKVWAALDDTDVPVVTQMAMLELLEQLWSFSSAPQPEPAG